MASTTQAVQAGELGIELARELIRQWPVASGVDHAAKAAALRRLALSIQ